METLIDQALGLDDGARRLVAHARRDADEAFRQEAWRAAVEMLGRRAEVYAEAWRRIGPAFIPHRLEELIRLGSRADPAEVAEWQEVARLTRLGIDDALLGLLAADSIPPPHVRELYRPWQTMLDPRGAQASASRMTPPPTTSSPS